MDEEEKILSEKELYLIDAYWRAANYLTVGIHIYIYIYNYYKILITKYNYKLLIQPKVKFI